MFVDHTTHTLYANESSGYPGRRPVECGGVVRKEVSVPGEVERDVLVLSNLYCIVEPERVAFLMEYRWHD